MKRAIAVALTLGLLAGAMVAPAEAGKKKKPKRVERQAQGTYAAPATLVGSCTQTDGIGCMGIVSGPGENFVSAEVTDSLGQPVAISVEADLDGNNTTETDFGMFCGKTDKPIAIEPGVELIFWVGRADVIAATACAPGIATQGTLDVTFSNLP